eukprot:769665-Amphidinium_carterae.1
MTPSSGPCPELEVESYWRGTLHILFSQMSLDARSWMCQPATKSTIYILDMYKKMRTCTTRNCPHQIALNARHFEEPRAPPHKKRARF